MHNKEDDRGGRPVIDSESYTRWVSINCEKHYGDYRSILRRRDVPILNVGDIVRCVMDFGI